METLRARHPSRGAAGPAGRRAGVSSAVVAGRAIGITGANGFIGAHLLRSAVQKGIRPVAFLQRGTSLVAIADLAGEYDAVEGDLLDPQSLGAFTAKCEAVFHLAGINRYWARDR